MQILVPYKHLQIHSCLLLKIATILRLLLKYQRISITKLYDLTKNRFNFLSYTEFILALDVLFILGKLKYHQNTDRVELIK